MVWFRDRFSIVADAMNNLSDASSNIVSVLGFKLASKPADPEHPYGHGRYEYLSGLVVAALVLLIGLELIKSSVERVIHPEPVDFSLALVAVLALSMVVKLWMAALNQKLGDRIESETLHATAQDSKNDVLATGAVLACAIVSQVTHINLDAWVGLAVGVYIGWSGFELIQDTVSPLLGQSPDPKLVKAYSRQDLELSRRFGSSRFDGSRLRPGQEVRKRSRRDGSRGQPAGKSRHAR